jgi:hypothetical protein
MLSLALIVSITRTYMRQVIVVHVWLMQLFQYAA